MAGNNKSKPEKYRFFVKDNVIFDIPSDVYSPRQVDKWSQSILKTARDLDDWVILSIPDISHTITQSAARQMKTDLSRLSEHGCKGLLILTSTVNAKIFAHALDDADDTSGLQITGSESIEKLCQKAQQLLGSQAVLNFIGE